MMNTCNFRAFKKGESCVECGFTLKKDYPDRYIRACGSQRQLGDWVESHLTSIGITKEVYAAVKEAVGLPPTCNCDDRREWLNRVGEKFSASLRTAFAKIIKE